MNRQLQIILMLILTIINLIAQDNKHFDNILVKYRLPLPDNLFELQRIDLDGDGDPDLIKYTINGFPVLWIDEDDEMKWDDIEGDTDNDCLLIDRNKDGKYGYEKDLIIKWYDENNDGRPDIQLVIDNSSFNDRGLWEAHYWWFFDTDQDLIFNYVNWDTFKLEAWSQSHPSEFIADYHGNSLFLKVHTNTFNITDLRYNWENPFLFYDYDNDGETEMTIRYIDIPFVNENKSVLFNPKIKNNYSVFFSHNISDVRISIDMDNDSNPSNPLDFDLSLKLVGEGFDYSDQIHKFYNLHVLVEADSFFADARWRHINELVFTDQKNGYKLPFARGKWNQCWFVYDEDDDCNRWERVEFYEPNNEFLFGPNKGGIDNNPQSDPAGDRGEWDLDFSGKGQLYVGNFDGKIHLYGAEKGVWRIDQKAEYFQGWGGWRGGNNLQPINKSLFDSNNFATIFYCDTDSNGFFDQIKYDLDGDHQYESVANLSELGIPDSCPIIDISKYNYEDFTKLESKVSNEMWKSAEEWISISHSYGLNTNWYANLMNHRTIREKYNNGFWLKYYLFTDLIRLGELKNDYKIITTLKKAYYSNNLSILK